MKTPNNTNSKYRINPSLLKNCVRIDLVGCGGTGSMVLQGLGRLNLALKAFNHPGIHVQVYDADIVTPANIGRQLFSNGDIGQSKAVTLVERVNQFYGLDWDALPTMYQPMDRRYSCDMIVSCCDNVKTRKEIQKYGKTSYFQDTLYWLDCGNRSHDGQVILGEFSGGLPTALDLYPNIKESEVDIPSCSLAEALEKQSLMINPIVANFALNLLSNLFMGEIDHHGHFINLKSGRVTPLMIDEKVWKRINPKLNQGKELA